MRLAPLILSIVILGIPGNLEAARPARKAVHVSSATHKVRRGETAAKVARDYGLSLEQLGDLNPRLNLSRLSIGTPLKVKGRAELKATKTHVASAPLLEEPQPSRLGPVVPVPSIPTIRANGPVVLLHLERLLPTNMNPAKPVSARQSVHRVPPMTSQDLQPIFPPTSGLEYESQVAVALGFDPADPDKLDFLWPVGTRSISSSWGPRVRTKIVRVVKAKKRTRRVKVRYQGNHKGVDLTAPMGTNVYAAQDGRVLFSGRNGAYGNCIFIDHGNGVETRYAHHKVNIAQVGDIVRRGQVIAEVGSTGVSTGPHLHFEVRLDGEARNPLPVLNDVEEIPAEMTAYNEMVRDLSK